MIRIRKFSDGPGRIPFCEWFRNLKDSRAQKRVKIRIDRLSIGLEGDWKAVDEGVRELRILEGKGYRVYYAWDGDTVVILLCGGPDYWWRGAPSVSRWPVVDSSS